MRIIGLNPGHDGAMALVQDGELRYSLEAEKDSLPRHSALATATLLTGLQLADGPPDVLAVGGWHGAVSGTGAGYFGLEPATVTDVSLLGHRVRLVSSSHERSHVFMAAGMAPHAPLEECVILVWEGQLGAFYHWRRYGASIERLEVLSEPGNRYGALFAIADPQFAGLVPRLEYAGKLMALAAFAEGPPGDDEREVADALMSCERIFPFQKSAFARTPLFDAGVHTPQVHRTAAYLSDALFGRFHAAAEQSLPRGLPLLISGGCGLNCEWNRQVGGERAVLVGVHPSVRERLRLGDRDGDRRAGRGR